MANVQYETKVGWDSTLIDLGYTDTENPLVKGLVETAIKITTGAPVATANKFMKGAFIFNAFDGTWYQNTGTVATPVWTLNGTGTGTVASVTGFYVGGTATNPTITVPKNNMTAIVAPTATDDSAAGYSIGSIWYNVTTSRCYVAQTVGVGAAVWQQVLRNQGQNAPDAVVAPLVTDDNTGGWSIGSFWFNSLTGLMYVAQDVTTGAAVWTALSPLPALTTNHILVGSAGGVATDVAMSGDATILASGAITVNKATGGSNFEVLGGVVNAGATLIAGFIPTTAATPQALTGPGIVLLTSYQTQYTSTGAADALTMAVGTKMGQLKKISYVAEGGAGDTAVVTMTGQGFTTATFNTITDNATFLWNGAAWLPIEINGTVVLA